MTRPTSNPTTRPPAEDKNTSNQALVAEYWYNDLGHRIIWHSDTSRSGGGASDGTVDTNDPKVHFIYNERWQQVATYRQANGSNIDTHPKEQFVNHAAGLAGYGSSSYIDGVILRDDHEDDWTEAADSTMERRVYHCQNWRADVVALLSENGRVLERAWYEPYGTPHGVSPADFSGTSDDTNDHYLVPDGDADADDSFVYLDLFGVSTGLSDTTGSSDPGDPEYGRPNGTVDSDDYFYYLDQYSVAAALGRNVLSAGHDGATASHGAGNLRNRKGLAGYDWDPHVRRYHVRNRVLYPEIGRWTRRDPLGYVDGMGLYSYGAEAPVVRSDVDGLCCQPSQPASPAAPQPGIRPIRVTPQPFYLPPNQGVRFRHCFQWAMLAYKPAGIEANSACYARWLRNVRALCDAWEIDSPNMPFHPNVHMALESEASSARACMEQSPPPLLPPPGPRRPRPTYDGLEVMEGWWRYIADLQECDDIVLQSTAWSHEVCQALCVCIIGGAGTLNMCLGCCELAKESDDPESAGFACIAAARLIDHFLPGVLSPPTQPSIPIPGTPIEIEPTIRPQPGEG